MLQEFESHSSDIRLVANALEPVGHGVQLCPGNLSHQGAGGHGLGKLALARRVITEEGLVVLNLLVEDGGRLLVELRRDVILVDQSLALVQPLSDLTELAGEGRVQ